MRYTTYEVRVYANGSIHWYLNGKPHRENGPAVEWANGDLEWWLNGKLHREDGPAVEHTTGDNCWYLHGKRHRVDGPAVEYASGYKEWWLHGKKLTEQDWQERTSRASCANKVIEMDGKKYKLVEI